MANFFCNERDSVGFGGHAISVSTRYLCCHSLKAAMANTQMNESPRGPRSHPRHQLGTRSNSVNSELQTVVENCKLERPVHLTQLLFPLLFSQVWLWVSMLKVTNATDINKVPSYPSPDSTGNHAVPVYHGWHLITTLPLLPLDRVPCN